MKFEYIYTEKIIEGKIVYRNSENSFDIEPIINTDISVLIGNLNIGIDSENFLIQQIWGYHPYSNWIKTELELPISKKGILKLITKVEPGTTKRLESTLEWNTYFDEKTGWVCIGNKVLIINDNSIEILRNGIIVLAKNKMIKALWLKPNRI